MNASNWWKNGWGCVCVCAAVQAACLHSVSEVHLLSLPNRGIFFGAHCRIWKATAQSQRSHLHNFMQNVEDLPVVPRAPVHRVALVKDTFYATDCLLPWCPAFSSLSCACLLHSSSSPVDPAELFDDVVPIILYKGNMPLTIFHHWLLPHIPLQFSLQEIMRGRPTSVPGRGSGEPLFWQSSLS